MKEEADMITNREFWKAAGTRALRTFAQTMAASIGTAMVLSDVNWTMALSASALAAILSLVMSVATGLPEAPKEAAHENDR